MADDMEEMLFLSKFLAGGKPVELLKQLFSLSISPMLITDAGHLDGGYRIIYANRAFCRLTGYELAELVGQSPRIFQGPESRRDVLARLASDLKSTGYFRGMSYNYRKDGSCYPLEWDISPIRNSNGNIKFFVSVQRDLTQVLSAARQIKEVNEHVRQFINDVSHGKVDADNAKQQSKTLLTELKDNARLYTPPLSDDDDVFFDFDTDSGPLDGKKDVIAARDYNIDSMLSKDEVNDMQESVKDVEEEVGLLASDPSQLFRLDTIADKLRCLSDHIFFLVEFTDTALAIAEVADSLPSMTEKQLRGFAVEFLQSLVVEIDAWIDGVFIARSATNIFDGAGNIIASAKQLTSMAKMSQATSS